MAKLIKLLFLVSMNLLLIQHACCKREKRGITDFLIPGINVGDLAIEALQRYIYGAPVDKDQIILDKQLEHLEMTREILSLTQEIAVTSASAPELTVLIQTLQLVPKYFNSIDDAFRQYEVYERAKRNSTDYQVRQFAIYSNNRYIGPIKDIINLYSITIPSLVRRRTSKGDYSLLSLIARQMKGYMKMCDKFKSQRQMMQIMMEGITVSELKTFLIMEFAIRKLAETEIINYQREVDQLKRELLQRFERLTGTFQEFMADASAEVWRCDPEDRYVEGETYFKLNNLFQVYFARDHDLDNAKDCYYHCGTFSQGSKETSCRDADFGYIDIDTNYIEYSACKSVPKCNGRLYDCYDRFASHSEFWTCPADQKANGTRRYDFIIHGNVNRILSTRTVTRYGPDKGQSGCRKQFTYDYRRYDGNFNICEMCSCICDDSDASYSDKTVSLLPVSADRDFVVTGVRWVKQDHVMHLQIEQGRLLPRGKIEASSIQWKPVQKVYKPITLDLSWRKFRGFFLTDIKVPEDRVVVGVKFEQSDESNVKLLTLGVLSVPYDYEAGKLRYTAPYSKNNEYIFNYIWHHETAPLRFSGGDEMNLGPAHIPTTVKTQSLPVDASKKYVLLTTSNFETDLGQSTVPFFDMQSNILSTPMPLSGMGIYLKRQGTSGGFLALKIMTYDNTRHITEKI